MNPWVNAFVAHSGRVRRSAQPANLPALRLVSVRQKTVRAWPPKPPPNLIAKKLTLLLVQRPVAKNVLTARAASPMIR
jgi:hypothetical protein